ncbi:hypothetical protein [Natrinema amylolyticum]|uniref:hypothetical protein n=1 Tax=Natrinema amylolyticum TaxID=2878679 RepID=UPI001CFB4378|nr:hypothetical protein [Natrinema amylolyticum]
MTVRHRDGIHFERERGESGVVADARSAVGAVNVVSHAHADHTFRTTPETVVCSAEYGYRARPLKRNQTTLEEFR